MALTGGRIVANIYAKNNNPTDRLVGWVNGRTEYFPNSGVIFSAPNPVKTVNSVTIGSVIEVLPQGLRVNSDFYDAVETPAQLLSNGS
jgi:hypothetical protein